MDFLKNLINPLGFDNLSPGPTDEQKEVLTKAAAEHWKIAQDFHSTFSTPHGKRVLKHLRTMTIESATWMTSLGLINGVAHGFAREGQNALVRYCEDQVKAAVDRAEQSKKEEENARRSKT